MEAHAYQPSSLGTERPKEGTWCWLLGGQVDCSHSRDTQDGTHAGPHAKSTRSQILLEHANGVRGHHWTTPRVANAAPLEEHRQPPLGDHMLTHAHQHHSQIGHQLRSSQRTVVQIDRP
eukprot:6345905-Amphidinium_carterae.1